MTARQLRAVIADDEPLARRVIRDLLEAEDDVVVVAEARNGLDAITMVRASKPDLLFLDIDMPDVDGFGVVSAIAPHASPQTIFVTAYDAFAVRAFEEEALDYLVKPFTDDRFRKTLTRVRQRAAGSIRPSGDPGPYLERVRITVGTHTRWIDLAAVRWIEADDYYARLHTPDGAHLIRLSLAALEQRLAPESFIRVHRRALVSRAAVKCLTRARSGEHALVLVDGTRVSVSDRRLRSVIDWMSSVAPDGQ